MLYKDVDNILTTKCCIIQKRELSPFVYASNVITTFLNGSDNLVKASE